MSVGGMFSLKVWDFGGRVGSDWGSWYLGEEGFLGAFSFLHKNKKKKIIYSFQQ